MQKKQRALAYARLFVHVAGSVSKKETLDAVVKEVLAYLIHQKNRSLLPDILSSLDIIWKERYGIARAHVETAHPLSPALRTQLLEALHGASLKEEVRPELLGGMRLRLDDRVLDNTLLKQLALLTQTLS